MKHRIIIVISCVLIACILTGCQLALEDMGTNEDRMVGVFITTEYLDLSDAEVNIVDILSSQKGSELTVDGSTLNSKERLYGELITNIQTDEETGEAEEVDEYIFGDIQGITYFSSTIPATDSQDSYITFFTDETINDAYMDVNCGDEEDSITLEGTIYTASAPRLCSYYFNPVYQSSDGRVFTTSGEGLQFYTGSDSEDSLYSHKLTASITEIENGKSKIYSISIAMSLRIMSVPEKNVVLQMNADHELISQVEYMPGTVPRVFKPDTAAEYLVVETHEQDGEGNPTISRSIYDKDAESMKTFYVREDGICVGCETQIEWE